MIRKFNIDGCRRRRGDPGRGRPRFHCDGDVGPPCIVKRGDMVYLDVDFGSGTIFATYKSEWDFEVSSRNHLEFLLRRTTVPRTHCNVVLVTTQVLIV